MTATGSGDIDAEARLLVFNRWVMLVGQAIFFAVLLLIWVFFSPVVPATVMNRWSILAGSLAALVLLFDVVFFIARPDDVQLVRYWRVIDKRQTVLFDIIAAAVVWFLLPYGTEAHRIIVVAFCVGYVPMQMISDPENTLGNKTSIILVLGSFMVFLLLRGGLAMQVLATMVALYGAVLFYSADVFRSVVVNALKAQRALQQSNRELGVAVAAVSAERDAKTRFITAATHDLGQPLQAARLFGEVAQNATSAAERGRALERVQQTLGSAQTMLGNMLYHMRLEADAVDPQLRNCDIASVIKRLIEQNQPSAREAGARLTMRAASCMIPTDPVLLDRVLGNLLTNAITHSRGRDIRIIVRRSAERVQVLVRDDGRGVDPADREQIFEDYRQGRNSFGGFGLGLGSARRIASLLGGEVQLIERRKGACFALCLPSGAPA